MPVNQRVKILLKRLGLTQKQFSEKVGVNQELVSRTINGKTTPNFAFIEQLYLAFPDINPDWLLTGKGDIWKDPSGEGNQITQSGKRNDQRVNIGSQVNEPASGYGSEGMMQERISLLEELCKQKDATIAEKERYIRLLEKNRQ